jgi:myosin heavy subunit
MNNMKKNNLNFKTFKQIFLFSLILPFMFSAVRAENMEDKISENKNEAKEVKEEKTVNEKVSDKVVEISNAVKNVLFKDAENEIKIQNTEINKASTTEKVASTTKEIVENIKKQVKENKVLQTSKTKKTKKVTKNTCDIFLSILDKSENLDDKISSSLIKIDNLQKQVDSEFANRQSILENLKNVIANDVKDKDKEAKDTIQNSLQEAKEFYVDLDDKNNEFITYLENNICDKVKNIDADKKESEIDNLVTKEKIYKKTLSNILKAVVEDLQKDIEKNDK